MLRTLALSALKHGLIPYRWLRKVAELQEREHLRSLLCDLGVTLVVDVGACTGGFAMLLRSLGYTGDIVSIEPDPDTFQKLTANLAGDARWRGLNIGVGTNSSTLTLNRFTLPNLNSFRVRKGIDIIDSVEVEIRRLDEIWENVIQGQRSPVVLLKVDAEGMDREVVAGAADIVDRVAALQVEVDVSGTYEGESYVDALAYYRELGFDLVNVATASRSSRTRRLIALDCLMVKDSQPPTISCD